MKVEAVVFVSLLLDLFAFTIPLPLFPRLIQWFTLREGSDPNGFLSQTLQAVSSVRGLLYKPSLHSQRWDVVLLGGLMGSLFSTLQFFVSPHIGALSDRYGRRTVLLATMIGNIFSALVWIKSTTFFTYILSRVIGGLSEGNVQISIAILSDVTTPVNRSKALAFVGIAFSICFCIGPPIGAYFASQPIPSAITASGVELNIYAVPAAITLGLLLAETAFLVFALPETMGKGPKTLEGDRKGQATSTPPSTRESADKRLATLNALRRLHFMFLGLFSGMEFTLTFLTFDLFDWNNRQNGALLGSIGIISALLQGGYTRRAMPKVGEGAMAQRGVLSCAFGLAFLALLPHFELKTAVRFLQAGAVCLAFTSATVVTSLTSYASLQCDEGTFDSVTGKPAAANPQLAKGKALGQFRSSGQLGRAIGPLLACASYWTFGPSVTYSVGAAGMLILSASMRSLASRRAL